MNLTCFSLGIFLILQLASCSSDKADKAAGSDKAPSSGETSSSDKADKASGSKTFAQSPKKAGKAGKKADLSKLCESFDDAEMSKLIGKTMSFKNRADRSKVDVVCQYYSKDVESKVRSTIMVNCDDNALDAERHGRTLKLQTKESFSEVSGIGRWAGQGLMAAGSTRLFVFVHDQVDCRVQVSTNHLEEDVLRPFAEAVYKSLIP